MILVEVPICFASALIVGRALCFLVSKRVAYVWRRLVREWRSVAFLYSNPQASSSVLNCFLKEVIGMPLGKLMTGSRCLVPERSGTDRI